MSERRRLFDEGDYDESDYVPLVVNGGYWANTAYANGYYGAAQPGQDNSGQS
ncbi:hypothetical protein [Nocardia sp. NPDC127526]|uniref:hypothetical protein n=1 Tax=Nocardia sp. NPDC127526 TaxID=3345393 RepID=UPI00363F72B8